MHDVYFGQAKIPFFATNQKMKKRTKEQLDLEHPKCFGSVQKCRDFQFNWF